MALKHIQAILLLPIMVTLVIPGVIIATTNSMHIGGMLPAPFNVVSALAGILFIGLGLVLVIATARLFATIGRGTLAPWTPPQKLVVRGVYRYVRNPMISGVLAILLGEAMLLGSIPLLCWFSVAALVNLIYIPRFEEPGLERRFGVDYARYKQNVPRWIPRWKPWNMPQEP